MPPSTRVPVYRCGGVAPSWCPIPPSTPVPSRVPTVGPCVPGRAPAAAGRPPAERHPPVPPRQPPLQGPPRSVRRGRGGGGDGIRRISRESQKKIRKIPKPPKIAKSKTQRHSWVGVDFGRRGNRSEHATRTRWPGGVSRAVCPPAPCVLHLRSVKGPATSPLGVDPTQKTPTDGAAFATSSLDFFAKERLPMAFRVA